MPGGPRVFDARRGATWVAALFVCASCGRPATRSRDGGGDGGPAAVGAAGPAAQRDAFPTDLIDPQSRMGVIVASLTTADWEFLRHRSSLAAQKFAVMSGDPFSFFRGSLALFLRDWRASGSNLSASRFAADDQLVFGLGDAHPENFGTLRTAAGKLRVEPNDFDTADLLPYLWDVRRFAVGMCLAARRSNPSDPQARARTAGEARSIARAAAQAYAATIQALAAGDAPPAIENGAGNAALEDLFARAAEDSDRRTELGALTYLDRTRVFIRGTPVPAEPLETTRSLPARARLEIGRALGSCRATLPDPPSMAVLAPLDAVQEFGVGVGSLPRIRALVLVRGATTSSDDDLILELKELPPQGELPLPTPSAFPSPQARVRAALAAGWTERGADPLWGVGTWLGVPVQLRSHAGGTKTIRVSRLEGALGMPEVVAGLGAALARLLARMHAAAPPGGVSPAGAIASAIAVDPEGFADEQADLALRYCDQVENDWALFQQALALAGPTLGVARDDAALAGSPGLPELPDLRVLHDSAADPSSAGLDPPTQPVTINEICAVGDEFVEVTNVSGAAASLAGFSIADEDSDGGPRFGAPRFAPGTALAAGGRMVTYGGFATAGPGPQTDCPGGAPPCYHAAWDVSATRGEVMYLLDPDDVIIDQRLLPMPLPMQPPAPANAVQSWGRFPDGQGPFSTGSPSPGRANILLR